MIMSGSILNSADPPGFHTGRFPAGMAQLVGDYSSLCRPSASHKDDSPPKKSDQTHRSAALGSRFT